jgi:hypothetical protein
MRGSPFPLIAALTFLLMCSAPSMSATLIMVDWRACGYCQKFNREVAGSYASTHAGKTAPLRRVNALGSWPSDLRSVRRARGTPTFILVDNGREVGRFAGYSSRAHFWSRLNRLLTRID